VNENRTALGIRRQWRKCKGLILAKQTQGFLISIDFLNNDIPGID